MSRGGFRGRGRGRGGGPGGHLNPAAGMGTLSTAEWGEALRASSKNSGILFPPLDQISTSHLPAPTPFEDSLISLSLSLASRVLSHGPKLAAERKVVGIEIESYSDRFRDHSQHPSSSSKLDPVALRLDPSFFPPSLWKEYFDPRPHRQKGKGSAKDGERPIKKVKLETDIDGHADGSPDDGSSAESSVNDDFDFEDESDHQDYDANYFDNGEGDDDSGGEDEEGGGGGFDD